MRGNKTITPAETLLKILLLIVTMLCIAGSSSAQKYDLLVTTNNDSIACHIDSISPDNIYFGMRFNRKWIQTYYSKNQVVDYKLSTISKRKTSFKPGTSFIINPDSIMLNHYNRNLVYGTGSYLLYLSSFTLNYERIIYVSNSEKKMWSYRVGCGLINNKGKIALATLNNLRGKGKNKFEMNIGATYINEPHSFGPNYFTVVLNAGYRRQSPDGKFIFRTGIGTPEGLYFSLGYSF